MIRAVTLVLLLGQVPARVESVWKVGQPLVLAAPAQLVSIDRAGIHPGKTIGRGAKREVLKVRRVGEVEYLLVYDGWLEARTVQVAGTRPPEERPAPAPPPEQRTVAADQTPGPRPAAAQRELAAQIPLAPLVAPPPAPAPRPASGPDGTGGGILLGALLLGLVARALTRPAVRKCLDCGWNGRPYTAHRSSLVMEATLWGLAAVSALLILPFFIMFPIALIHSVYRMTSGHYRCSNCQGERLALAPLEPTDRPCPACAEPIRRSAIICRWCRSDVKPLE